MKVGGRDFTLTMGEVEFRMQGVPPEIVQKHAVRVGREVFPPKQVLAHVTGWERTSFTTMEAQRVLSKLGFKNYVAGEPEVESCLAGGRPEASPMARIGELEVALVTAHEAIAGLAARVHALEVGRR